MEDAATAEISRSQIWQWVHNGVTLSDTGETVTADLVRGLLAEIELEGTEGDEARTLFERVALDDDFAPFLTVPAYELID
jgi:malate synthase